MIDRRLPGRTRLHLRIDVDSFTGTKDGVPRLLALLARFGVRATFFLSLGPDRWGRAVFRTFYRRGFLGKMLRTNAIASYGLATCLRGTLLPAPHIARELTPVLKVIAERGHEIGLHCWDHLRWQDRLPRLTPEEIRQQVELAWLEYERIFQTAPLSWASPGWVTTPAALGVLDGFGFAWMSNSRGTSPYVPVIHGAELRTIDVPATTSTLDEVLGRAGVDRTNYLDHLYRQLRGQVDPVHTVHAETEGRRDALLLEALLERVLDNGGEVRPMGALAGEALAARAELPRCAVRQGEIPGRSGVVSIQDSPGELDARRTR